MASYTLTTYYLLLFEREKQHRSHKCCPIIVISVVKWVRVIEGNCFEGKTCFSLFGSPRVLKCSYSLWLYSLTKTRKMEWHIFLVGNEMTYTMYVYKEKVGLLITAELC